MHKTTTALLAAGVFLAVLLTVTGATWLGNGRHFGPPSQPRVEQAQAYSPAGAVCTTDADCATYDAAHHDYRTPVLAPSSDGGQAYTCPAGMDLYDTLNPAEGASGVVCAWLEA